MRGWPHPVREEGRGWRVRCGCWSAALDQTPDSGLVPIPLKLFPVPSSFSLSLHLPNCKMGEQKGVISGDAKFLRVKWGPSPIPSALPRPVPHGVLRPVLPEPGTRSLPCQTEAQSARRGPRIKPQSPPL